MGEKERMVKFRGSINGYHKKDVNEYIEKITRDFEEQSRGFEERYSRLERELNAEKEKNADLSARLDEMAIEAYTAQASLEGEKTARISAEKMLDEMTFEAYSAQEREAKLKEAVTGLCARIAEYERISEQNEGMPDELLKKINEKIDEMISAADQKCAAMLAEAQQEADRIRAEAENEAMASREKLKNIYKDAASEYYEEVLSFSQDIRTAVAALLHSIQVKGEELEGRIDYMRLESENAAREQGIIIDGSVEKAKLTENSPADEKTAKTTISLSLIDEKIENFFKNAINKINGLKDRK
ncbi:MAG: hypothetical protein IJR55_00830 [Clostridia bacterium]|nr:hypothetical protein [Clostridia bacterium]